MVNTKQRKPDQFLQAGRKAQRTVGCRLLAIALENHSMRPFPIADFRFVDTMLISRTVGRQQLTASESNAISNFNFCVMLSYSPIIQGYR